MYGFSLNLPVLISIISSVKHQELYFNPRQYIIKGKQIIMLLFKNGARYHSIGPYLTERFGRRTFKAAIDGGFTCPNRDGTRGRGGCIYCSEKGSGEYAGIVTDSRSADGRITVPLRLEATATASPYEQIRSQVSFIEKKWPSPLCIAYFQNFTNTYAPVEILEPLYRNALTWPDCVGLAIATRPDCIDDSVLRLLEQLNQETFLWVELGLQTTSDRTAAIINRCCSMQDYEDCVRRLGRSGIRYVTHLMFGLPGETPATMLKSVADICRDGLFGIKLHMLNVLKDTPLEKMWLQEQVPLMSQEEYISLVCDALEIIPRHVTIHRLTGDAPLDLLRAPLWSQYKKDVLNGINKEMKRRGSVQGCRA